MTIETKKVASVNEAINIINRLNYTNEIFHYKNSTFSDDYKVEYRFCDGVRDNDLPSGMSIIEIVTNGTIQTVRFFNHFRDIAVDLRIGDFTPSYERFDNVINVDTVDTENANNSAVVTEESAPADDFESKLAELQANVDAAQADYDVAIANLDAKNAELRELQIVVGAAEDAKKVARNNLDNERKALSRFMNYKVKELTNTLILADKFLMHDYAIRLHDQDGDRITGGCDQLYFHTMFLKFDINMPWHVATYDTPAQVTAAINLLKAAIERGDKEFKFPTVDELNNPPPTPTPEFKADNLWDKIQRESKPLDDDDVADLLPKVDELNDVQDDEPTPEYKPQCHWHNPHNYGEPGNLNFDPNDRLRAYLDTVDDKLIRAMRHNLPKFQAACHAHDITVALNELKLFAICRDAHKVELKEEFTPTPKRDRQTGDAVDYEQIEAEAIKYDDTVKDLDKQIEAIEDDCAFNQVCYDEPDDSRERIHFDAELKKLIDRGLRLIQKRDKLATHRDRLYLTIERLDAQAI